MKCQYCNGTGEHINDANRMTTCEFCGGTGVIKPMTNEEWLKSCNTNELAKFLSDATIDAFFRHASGELPRINGTEAWTRWLKEKHDGNT